MGLLGISNTEAVRMVKQFRQSSKSDTEVPKFNENELKRHLFKARWDGIRIKYLRSLIYDPLEFGERNEI